MIEIVGKDGVIYHAEVTCPASDIDADAGEYRALSDVEQRFLKVLTEGALLAPRVVQVK
jgi:hypothetical protein